MVPFAITPSTNIILRVIMPLASQPGADGMRVNGLGDVVGKALQPLQGDRGVILVLVTLQ